MSCWSFKGPKTILKRNKREEGQRPKERKGPPSLTKSKKVKGKHRNRETRDHT